MSSLPADPSGDDTRDLRAVAQSAPDVVSANQALDALEPSHLTSDRRSVAALVAEFRKAVGPRGSRERLEPPRVPTFADFESSKMRASRSKPVDVEQQLIQAQERIARQYAAKLHPARGSQREHNGYLRVWTYMSALAFRVMNDRHRAGEVQPDEIELRESVAAYISTWLPKFIRSWDPMQRRTGHSRFAYLDESQVDYLATTFAHAVIRDWTPDYIEERVRRGRAGGSRPKPSRRAWTPEDLDVLELFEHLRPSDRLRVFNSGRAQPSSRATVYRMLDALRERHAPETPPVHRQPTRREESAADRRERAEVDAGLREARRAYESEQIERRLAAEREHAERLARFESYART